MEVYDSNRQRLGLGERIGRGGEAEIYQVAGQPGWLAKIYSGQTRPEYPRKLAWMRDHPPEDPTLPLGHHSLAWPVDLLYDSRRNLVGYLMPQIREAVLMLEVFNPKLRAQVLPDFDVRYLLRAARNLAGALGALHERGYVVGDLNESNVLVTPSALITLIDTDSFQVREETRLRAIVHPCPVAKLEYTPPELQGKSFERVQRRPEHDAFGLGVLIFQLLMGGSHPFRGQWQGHGEPPPIEERIRTGCFPYAPSPACPVTPPVNAPTLDILHPLLRANIRRCFINGGQDPRKRPLPGDWTKAIEAAEKALIRCSNGHYYSSHLAACPACIPALVRTPPQPRPRPSRPAPGPRRASPGSSVLPNLAGSLSLSQASASARAPAFSPSPFSGFPMAGAGAPVFNPARLASRARAGLRSAFVNGGGLGGLAGALLAAIAGLLLALFPDPIDWGALLVFGGIAGGLTRGRSFGIDFGQRIGRRFGWQLVWQRFGAVAGGIGAGLLAWNLTGGFALILIFLPLGLAAGYIFGDVIWELGDRLGWVKIWTGAGILGGAGLGWRLGSLLGSGSFGAFTADLIAGGLVSWLTAHSVALAFAWLFAGALGGALSGALTGFILDLLARLLDLLR